MGGEDLLTLVFGAAIAWRYGFLQLQRGALKTEVWSKRLGWSGKTDHVRTNDGVDYNCLQFLLRLVPGFHLNDPVATKITEETRPDYSSVTQPSDALFTFFMYL